MREPHEWDEAHLEGAIHVPQGELLDRIGEVAPDHSERIVLYCRTDNRSTRAADALRDLGYDNVSVMEGGIVDWQEDGLPVVAAKGLTSDQRMRYSRHTLLPEVGVEGQLKLLNSKVLLIGAGGLGAPSAFYLAAAGVGTIGIVDDDVVDESNLQRQVIHTTDRVGMPKTASAKASIEALNPDVKVVEHRTRLNAENILDIISDYDVLVDGADNFPTRYLLNDASVRLRKPVVSASILAFDGQISTFVPYEGPCYRCLYPDAAAARDGAELRRRGRPRRHGRRHGPAAGERGHQARGRHRRAADRTTASLRLARNAVHRAQGQARPGLPDLRRPRARDPGVGDGQVPRLRGLLRRRAGASRLAARPTPRRIGFPTHADREDPASAPCPDRGRGRGRAPGATVGEVLRSLAEAHPGTTAQLFADGGDLNRYVNVYLNDEDVRVLDGLDTAVADSDTVVILPAMAGGTL